MNTLKKILSGVLATSMCLTLCQGMSASAYTYTEGEVVKIMCVGDSITDGYGYTGSYRKYLYNNLVANGFDVDMVGFSGSNEESYYDSESNSQIFYDGNYSAISGYAIQMMTSGEFRNGIYETLVSGNTMATYEPDIVLLQIGTNDVISNYNDGIIDRLENLVDYMMDNMADDGVVFVTTIPYMDATDNQVTSWFAHYDDYSTVSVEELAQEINDCVASYNAQIKEMVERKVAEGCTKIQFADVNSVVDYKTELRDGVHPNDAGYQDMGSYWCDVLTAYLSGEPIVTTTTVSETEATTTTTEETTVDQETVFFPEDTTTDSSSDTTVESSVTEVSTEETTTTEATTEAPDVVQPTYPVGDLNYDGTVSNLDLLLLKKRVLNAFGAYGDYYPEQYPYDINGDGDVNVLDVIALKKTILNG